MPLLVESVDTSPVDEVIWASETLGEIIRKAREARGLTQKEVAERCDHCISGMSISQFEKDERIPKLKHCRKIATALGLDQRRFVRFAMNIMIRDVQDLFVDEQPVYSQVPHPLDTLYQDLCHAYDALPEDEQHSVLMAFQFVVRSAQTSAQAHAA